MLCRKVSSWVHYRTLWLRQARQPNPANITTRNFLEFFEVSNYSGYKVPYIGQDQSSLGVVRFSFYAIAKNSYSLCLRPVDCLPYRCKYLTPLSYPNYSVLSQCVCPSRTTVYKWRIFRTTYSVLREFMFGLKQTPSSLGPTHRRYVAEVWIP